ncbi:MAG: LPS export ABC transporter permease LptG [Chromatiales bacterium]|jgi:lipopolysaccharide export system permease protein|nr:LPS export ABC transporter permease LptG [Chromatiales bacterium]
MRILDTLIGKMVIGGALLVLCVLLSLFVFIEFISELDRIGQGDYTAWMALKYALFSAPRLAYELMPLAALLGSLVGLGLLASNNELVAMRSTGVSLARIGWAAVKAGLLLVVFTVWLGEWVVDAAEEYAANTRATALAGAGALRTQAGFWTRDGDSFVSVRAVSDDGELAGIMIYNFDGKGALTRISTARSATYQGDHWLLNKVMHNTISETLVTAETVPNEEWRSRLDPSVLDVLAVKPGNMSMSGLFRYIDYLRDNGLDTARYERELWNKLMMPFATAAMVFAALPFVFGSLRSVGIGQRLLTGVMVGLTFYLVNQAVSYAGLAYGLNPALVGISPTVLLLIVSVLVMRRVT